MAEIVVERSPLAEFLDEMPSLIMQYKQMQMAQDEKIADREYQEKLLNSSREWELNSMLLQDSRNRQIEARKALSELQDNYMTISGKMPTMSESASDIINASYEGDMMNLNNINQFYDDQTVALEKEKNRLANQIYTAGVVAKEEYAKRFPDYANLNTLDDTIDAKELDMLLSDIKKEGNKETIAALAERVKLMESGDRAIRTNNPGAMIYADWQTKYGATKDEENAFWQYTDNNGNMVEVYSEDDIPKGKKASKYYTATFPDKSSGESALEELVEDMWSRSEGNLAEFTKTYTGLDPESKEFKTYNEALSSLDIFDNTDLVSGLIKDEYFRMPAEQRMSISKTNLERKAAEQLNYAKEGYMMLQGIDTDQFNLEKVLGSQVGEIAKIAFSQSNVQEFYKYLNNPVIQKSLINALDEGAKDRSSKYYTRIKQIQSYMNQSLTAMDSYFEYKNPTASNILNPLDKIIEEGQGIESAFIDFMGLMASSDLDEKMQANSFEVFKDSMVEKYGEGALSQIELLIDEQIKANEKAENVAEAERILEEIERQGPVMSGEDNRYKD